MADGDYADIGSNELSQEDFDSYEQMDDDILQELAKVVKARDEAKSLLSTEFGISLRKLLRAQKLHAMMDCAVASAGPEHDNAKIRYEVACGVEKIFSIVIVDGDEALAQIEQQLR